MRTAARDTAAAIAALVAYLTTVLPGVHRELKRWRKSAGAIRDPDRRRQALAALEEKRANVEAVAVFATLAPLRQRRAVLRAIVPLQVAIDYRDTLEEAGIADRGDLGDGGHLARLDAAWREQVAYLPGAGPTAQPLEQAVERCEVGQRRTHAAEHGDLAALEGWGRHLSAPPSYRWWEVAAGSSSSVAAHALIATAAHRHVTPARAQSVDAAYHPAIGALTVLLDDLVDRDQDRATRAHNYTGYYGNATEAAERIAAIGRDARKGVAPLAQHRRHAAILAGVAAYYLSDAGARDDFGTTVGAELQRALGPSVHALASVVAKARGLGLLADTGA